jgi:hypothetical protein
LCIKILLIDGSVGNAGEDIAWDLGHDVLGLLQPGGIMDNIVLADVFLRQGKTSGLTADIHDEVITLLELGKW